MASLDYSKAFDILSHQILLNKLSNIGQLKDRRQHIKYKGALFNCELIPYGVLQGSSISPTLIVQPWHRQMTLYF